MGEGMDWGRTLSFALFCHLRFPGGNLKWGYVTSNIVTVHMYVLPRDDLHPLLILVDEMTF